MALLSNPSLPNRCLFSMSLATDATQQACELGDGTIATSAQSFLGWTLASKGDARKVRQHQFWWCEHTRLLKAPSMANAIFVLLVHVRKHRVHFVQGLQGLGSQRSVFLSSLAPNYVPLVSYAIATVRRADSKPSIIRSIGYDFERSMNLQTVIPLFRPWNTFIIQEN